MNNQGTRTRKPMKSKPKNQAALPWIIATLVLFPANFLYLYNMRTPSDVLAEMGGRQLRRSDLPPASAAALQSVESFAYTARLYQVRDWASKIVLEEEAKRQQTTPEKLLDAQLSTVPLISEADILERYAKAPLADKSPYPAVLDEIRQALQSERSAAARRAYLTALFEKEGLKILSPEPAGYEEPPMGLVYPVYTPPSAQDVLGGRVVGPPSKGRADAPITLEIYSDFMCPYSRKLAQIQPELEKKYGGRLRTVYNHFPLPFHKGADKLAEASACAQEQGKFWEMHDVLMAWEGEAGPAKLAEAAQKIGVEPGAFSACMQEGRYAGFVAASISEAQKKGVNSTPTFFINGRMGAGALPLEMLTGAMDWFENPKGEYPGRKFNPTAQQAPPPPAPIVDDKPVEFDKEFLAKGPSEGPADAPVTVIEFIDYNCPFCQRGALDLEPVLKASKTPLRLLSKQLPLPMHPNAEKHAVAALCADEQGKYWPFRAQIFGKYWGKQTVDDLKTAAAEAGLNRKKFDDCLDNSKTLDRVKADVAVGTKAGVNGTPTYFVNGKRIVGANTPEIQKALEEASAPKK